MIKFDLRLNPETIEQIKQAAQKDSRTVSAMARKILEDYFKEYVIVHSKETGDRIHIPTSKYPAPILVNENILTIPLIKIDKNK